MACGEQCAYDIQNSRQASRPAAGSNRRFVMCALSTTGGATPGRPTTGTEWQDGEPSFLLRLRRRCRARGAERRLAGHRRDRCGNRGELAGQPLGRQDQHPAAGQQHLLDQQQHRDDGRTRWCLDAGAEPGCGCPGQLHHPIGAAAAAGLRADQRLLHQPMGAAAREPLAAARLRRLGDRDPRMEERGRFPRRYHGRDRQ